MTVNNSDMFNVLHDRILIINRAGKVVYANASARADFSGELSALLNLPMLRDAINRITVQGLRDVIDLKLSPDPSQPDKITQVSVVLAPIDPAIFNLKYWMVPPYRDDGNHRYEKTDTGSPV